MHEGFGIKSAIDNTHANEWLSVGMGVFLLTLLLTNINIHLIYEKQYKMNNKTTKT